MAVVPKLLRRSTLLAATSYRFTLEDGIVMPGVTTEARKIGLGRRALTGYMTGANKVEGLGPFESSLERDLFTLLEFDPTVIAWHPQPVRIDVPASKDKRARKYTPDVAIEYAREPGSTELHRVELCEVKYREELKAKWDDLKPLLREGLRYARREGWSFKIYTELEIRTPQLANAKFLLPYRDRPTDGEDVYRIWMRLDRIENPTPTTILDAVQRSPAERARLLGVLWHMVALGYIKAGLGRPLNMNSPLWRNAHATL